ncbi:hypothetical protein [Novosphingobium sp.]|uniref:hypothetical protein n=1 Tax=Novosphingobium sp. TaxID=1874826 RepID=UPI0028B1D957|nr:hypothetical protein [Novosphingobium sp.]
MANDQLTLPLTDDDLLRLAQYRYAQADREGATTDDYVQLVDIFPAVLQRLEEKIGQTRGLVRIEQIDLNDPAAWQRFAAEMAE